MITFRTKTLIVISLIIFVVLAISILLFVIGKNNNNDEIDIDTNREAIAQIDSVDFEEMATPVIVEIPSGVTVKKLTTEDALKNSAIQMSKIFIERYGTYSSDSNYANIREVKTIVTQRLWDEISQILDTTPPDEFMGVTTNAISSKIVEFDDDSVLLKLSTRKIVTNSDNSTESKIVDANVWLSKSGENWLVEKIEWK